MTQGHMTQTEGSLFFARAWARAFETLRILLVFSAIFSPAAHSDAVSSTDSSISDLRGADRSKKFRAFEALQHSRSPKAGDAVVAQLSDADVHVRLAALDSLAAQGDGTRVPAIAPLLRDAVPAVRQRAANTIGRLNGPLAEPALLKALRVETEPGVRSAIVQGLSLCGSTQSVADLEKALADKRPEVRANAAKALGRIPGKEAARALQSHTESDRTARKAFDEALRQKSREAK